MWNWEKVEKYVKLLPPVPVPAPPQYATFSLYLKKKKYLRVTPEKRRLLLASSCYIGLMKYTIPRDGALFGPAASRRTDGEQKSSGECYVQKLRHLSTFRGVRNVSRLSITRVFLSRRGMGRLERKFTIVTKIMMWFRDREADRFNKAKEVFFTKDNQKQFCHDGCLNVIYFIHVRFDIS